MTRLCETKMSLNRVKAFKTQIRKRKALESRGENETANMS